jgi:hypothetical protein
MRSEAGRAALARNGQRILTAERLVASRYVAAETTKRREQILSALGVNPVVGGNSATEISSPKGTLFVTILSFSLAVTHLSSTTY